MSKLLRANFSRLKKEKIFWIAVIFMIGYCMILALMFYYSMKKYGGNVLFDNLFIEGYGMSGTIALPGLVMAAVVSLFLGTEYSDGTIRNKLIIGHTRSAIYVSDFLTCAIIGVILNAVYLITACAIGLPLFGLPAMDVKILFLTVLDGLLMYISYAAVFTFSSMLFANKTTSSVVNILAVILLMFVCMAFMSMLMQPEMTDLYEIVNGETVTTYGPNPHYVGGVKRLIYQFLIDFLPSGQSIQISFFTASHWKLMALYSAVIIAGTNAAGILLFRKKDIK